MTIEEMDRALDLAPVVFEGNPLNLLLLDDASVVTAR